MSSLDIGVLVVAAVVLFIAAGAGMGGGPVLVPVYLSLGQFSQSAAVALSNSTILAGSCANVLCNGRKRHPFRNKSLVDWDLILLMEPPTLLGAVAGSYINKLLPVAVSHVLLALLLTLMTARVVQRARLIYSRETAARIHAAQANTATAAAAAAPVAAAGPAAETPVAAAVDRACDGSRRTTATSLGGADAVVQLSAVAKPAAAPGSCTIVADGSAGGASSSRAVSRRPSRAAVLDPQPNSDRAAAVAAPAPASPAAGAAGPVAAPGSAARLPSSTLLPLEIEGNISEAALAQLVGPPQPAAALQAPEQLRQLQAPPAAAAGAWHPGEPLFAGTSSAGQQQQQQQQQAVLVVGQPPADECETADAGSPPSEAECKLLYAPPGHTRRESWEAFDDDWDQQPPELPTAAQAASGHSLSGLSVASGLSISQQHLLAGRSGPSSTAAATAAAAAAAGTSRFAAAAAAAGVDSFGSPRSTAPNNPNSSYYQSSALARNSTSGGGGAASVGASSGGGADPTQRLLINTTPASGPAPAASGSHPAVGSPRAGGRCSQRPPEVASAAAAVAVEPVLRAEAVQLPLFPVALLAVLFVAVLLTSLLSKMAGCGSLAYWLVQWAVAPVLFGVWWVGRRHVLSKVALKRAALVDFHGEVRWTSRNSVVFPATCSIAGVIAGMFGLGGAVVKTPLMLELGVHPQVTAATTQTMLLLTSAASTIVYAQLGDIPGSYAAAIMPLAFCVTLCGQFAIDWLVNKVGRSSLVVLVLAGFFSVACLLTFYITGVSLAHLARDPQAAMLPGKICGG